jgi:hypothetical protein
VNAEWEAFKLWITAPFTQRIPPITLLVIVAISFVLIWVVYDNLDIIKRGFKTVEAAKDAVT